MNKSKLEKLEKIVGINAGVNNIKFKGIDFHKNILVQAYSLKLDAHQTAEALIEASNQRKEMLPTFDQFGFDDTQCLSTDETDFLEKYRDRVGSGKQFESVEAMDDEIKANSKFILEMLDVLEG